MADPRFFDNKGPFTLAELARAGGTSAPEDAAAGIAIHDVASMDASHPFAITFVASKPALLKSGPFKAAAIICQPELAATLRERAPVLETKDPASAFSRIAHHFYPNAVRGLGANPNAAVDPTANIAIGVTLEPGVVIGPHAEIGPGTHISANTVIGRGVAIGRDCFIGPNASIVAAYVGDGVIIHAGARIGQDGFGFNSGPAGHLKVPQLGRVIIQDQVEIGANCTIDRGALGDTVIGEGTKFDNMVHIAHNDIIGRHVLIAAQAGIAGSTHVGDYVAMGGQAGLGPHMKVGPAARIVGGSLAQTDLEGGQDYCGIPAIPIRDFLRTVRFMRKVSKGEVEGS